MNDEYIFSQFDSLLGESKSSPEIEEDQLIDTMAENFDKQNDPFVGIFWYDADNDELFGVVKESPESIPFNVNGLRTGKTLHRNFWRNKLENQVIRKQSGRKFDERYFNNYTKVPRGRIFQTREGTFQIATGNWIDLYPWVIDDVIEEFNLKNSKVKHIRKEHWDLGHGWSE